MKAVIICDGLAPKKMESIQLLKDSTCLICCDGAINKLERLGIMPHVIVGDMDSITSEQKYHYAKIIEESKDQETNDLTKAINWCKHHNITEVDIIGATGLREDHTLGNISLLAQYVKDVKATMISDFGSFECITQTTSFTAEKGQQISIFSLDSSISLRSEGLKYPLDGIRLNQWWKASLNETTDTEFTIYLDKPAEIIVYKKHY